MNTPSDKVIGINAGVGGGGNGGDFGERLARLETKADDIDWKIDNHLATRADMESLKTGIESIKVEIEKTRTGFWKVLFTTVGTATVVATSAASIIVKLID